MKAVCKGKLNVADFGLLSAVGLLILTLPAIFIFCFRTETIFQMFHAVLSLDNLHHALLIFSANAAPNKTLIVGTYFSDD